MKHQILLFTILFIVALSCSATMSFAATSDSSTIQAQDLLPSMQVLTNWEIVEGPDRYNPDTLFELVNGAAPFYLNLGFQKLVHARYQNTQDRTMNVTLDIYDQKTVEGGFGVYSSSRHPNEKFRKWGAQGYRSGPLAVIWKDRFYITLQGDDERQETIHALEIYADWISERIPGKNNYPKLMDCLPKTNRIMNTELYSGEDYLGYRNLDRTMSAQYRIMDSTITIFVMEPSSSETLKKTFSEITQMLGPRQPVSMPTNNHNYPIYATTNKYLGNTVVFTVHKLIYGLIDSRAANDFTALLSMVDTITGLNSPSP